MSARSWFQLPQSFFYRQSLLLPLAHSLACLTYPLIFTLCFYPSTDPRHSFWNQSTRTDGADEDEDEDRRRLAGIFLPTYYVIGDFLHPSPRHSLRHLCATDRARCNLGEIQIIPTHDPITTLIAESRFTTSATTGQAGRRLVVLSN